MITRRQALKTAVLSAAALAVVNQLPSLIAAPLDAKSDKPPEGPFKLPPLPYAFDAMEPHIDARTMEIHHDKHHAAYVNNLNKAVADYPDLQKKSVDDLIRNLDAVPEPVRTAVRNNGGGDSNHSLFWLMLSQKGSRQPTGELAKALDTNFGGFSKFQEAFTKAAASVFGSGWAWLSLTPKKELLIETTPNQNSPIMEGRLPLLGIDVWEHAYYLKRQNRRPEYIAAFYNVINWDFVSGRYRTLAT